MAVGKEATEIKYDWFKKTLEIFGRCGLVLYLDGKPVGYSQYAPPSLLPNVGGMHSPYRRRARTRS
ncbi:MAG: hypothetical protein SAMD01599839_15440 [Rectinema sp.]